MAIALMAVALLSSPQVFAAEETMNAKKENVFVGWFRKFVQKFSWNFKKDSATEYSLGDMKNPSGTPMVKPSGEPEQKDRLTDEERLTKLVTNGKITEAQKAAILTELATLKATYGEDVLNDLTQEERQQKMQEMREALKAWATAEGIAIGFVMPEVSGQEGQPPQNDDRGGKQGGAMKRPSGTPKPFPTEAE
ncbi:MAG: hypothetical protein WAV51_02240 [Microgenomates group bacterium]